MTVGGSGLLMPALDELIDRSAPGVLAVLDAADALHRQIEDAEYRASFAPFDRATRPTRHLPEHASAPSITPDSQGQVLDGGGEVEKTWIFEGRLRQPRVLKSLLRELVRCRFGHHRLLALHGLVTRYGTGAILAASRWLQRRAWVRRAAVILRPSDTMSGPGAGGDPAGVRCSHGGDR